MSDRIVICCDGTFDDGRMPCRGSISFPAALYATVANDDLTDRYAARIAAFEKGWTEEGGPRLLPIAHPIPADEGTDPRCCRDGVRRAGGHAGRRAVNDVRVREVLATLDLFDGLLDPSWAATYIGVSVPTIRKWKSRGHLQAAGRDEFGRALYRPIDLLRAQAAAEENATRTQTSNLTTRRASPGA